MKISRKVHICLHWFLCPLDNAGYGYAKQF